MKTFLLGLFCCALAGSTLQARNLNISDAPGIKDACDAGALLDANHISYQVIVFRDSSESGAGCLYEVNGSKYLYSPEGSTKISEAQLSKVSYEKVARDEVLKISDGDQSIRNGCLVFATCTYHQYHANSHIVWGGLIKAEVLEMESFGWGGGGSLSGVHGHVITAFENDKREVYIQENGKKPKLSEPMTKLAQNGDPSWHNASTLIYAGDRTQAITNFECEFGSPR